MNSENDKVYSDSLDVYSSLVEQIPPFLYRFAEDIKVVNEIETKFRIFDPDIINILGREKGVMPIFAGNITTTRFRLPNEQKNRFPYSIRLRNFIPDQENLEGTTEASVKIDTDDEPTRQQTRIKGKIETIFSLKPGTIVEKIKLLLKGNGFILADEPGKHRYLYLIQFFLNGEIETVEIAIDDLYDKRGLPIKDSRYVEVEASNHDVFHGFMSEYGERLGLSMDNALPISESELREILKQ